MNILVQFKVVYISNNTFLCADKEVCHSWTGHNVCCPPPRLTLSEGPISRLTWPFL